MMVDTEDLVSNMEIAAMAGVSKQAVTNWFARHETFPDPIASFGNGKFKLFLRSDVAAWLETPRPRRPSEKAAATRRLFIEWMEGRLSNIGDHSCDYRNESLRFKDEAMLRAQEFNIEWDDELEERFQTG